MKLTLALHLKWDVLTNQPNRENTKHFKHISKFSSIFIKTDKMQSIMENRNIFNCIAVYSIAIVYSVS